MTKAEIIAELNKQYLTNRTMAQAKAYANLQKLRQNPQFYELDQQIKQLNFTLGKAKAFNLNDSIALELQLSKLEEERAKLITQLGYKESDLEPDYVCKICEDTGRVNGKVCECYKQKLYQMLLSNTGSKTDLADFSMFNEKLIKNQKQRDTLLKLKNKMENWVKDYPKTSTYTFLLCGGTGVGKTFMTECVARAMIDKGYLVSFISATGMNNNFLKYHTTFTEGKESYYDVLTEPELLVIDDLGTEPILNNITTNYLCALLNDRFERKKATIITTNLNLDNLLSRYGNRIFSRICNKMHSELYNISGDDLRLVSPKTGK